MNSTDFVNITKYRLMTALSPKHPEPLENPKKKRSRADPIKFFHGKI
jgi:hypothetical protein